MSKGFSRGLTLAILSGAVTSAWGMVLSVGLVPVYLRYLGAEGYGLVGFNTTFLSIVTLLDGGLTLTVNRELAKATHAGEQLEEARNILTAGIALFTSISVLIAAVIWFLSPWVAIHWLNATKLPHREVIFTIRLIGITSGEQLLVALFQGSLFGLHRQTTANVIRIGTLTVRAIGTVLVLAFLSSTPSAFFAWYGISLLLQIVALRTAIGMRLGGRHYTSRLRFDTVKSLFRHSRGFGVIAILALLLSQTDKVLVSRLLPLAEFGYYMVAVSISMLPLLIAGPFVEAIFPRFARLTTGDPAELHELLHFATKVVGSFVVPLGITLAAFSRPVVYAWTGNGAVATHISTLVALLATGYSINGSLQVCSYFEMAHARTRLIAIANSIALLVIIPSMILLSKQFGATGIAACWLILNLGLLGISVPIVLRPGLGRSVGIYYTRSLLPPYIVSGAVIFLARLFISNHLARLTGALTVIAVFAIAITACFMLIPSLRNPLLHFLKLSGSPSRSSL